MYAGKWVNFSSHLEKYYLIFLLHLNSYFILLKEVCKSQSYFTGELILFSLVHTIYFAIIFLALLQPFCSQNHINLYQDLTQTRIATHLNLTYFLLCSHWIYNGVLKLTSSLFSFTFSIFIQRKHKKVLPDCIIMLMNF